MNCRLVLIAILIAGCDSVQPEDTSQIVVEAFLIAGETVPEIRLWRTAPIGAPYRYDASTAVNDATMSLMVGDQTLSYVPANEGRYSPMNEVVTPPYAPLDLLVTWAGQRIEASSRVPPLITIDSLHINRSELPVRGLLLDSLLLGPVALDSLGTQDSLRTGAQEGYLYLVEASLHWTVDFREVEADSAWWIRAHLAPDLETSGQAEDYFLRTQQLQRERTANSLAPGHRYWSGVYAVPVEAADVAMPRHLLRVSLVRSPYDYARFVAGRSSPGDREPPSNVAGARGIFTGLALDSMVVVVQ